MKHNIYLPTWMERELQKRPVSNLSALLQKAVITYLAIECSHDDTVTCCMACGQILDPTTVDADDNGRKRRLITNELLREVAEVYSQRASAPTVAVAKRFGISHRNATRWVMLARQRGYLPPYDGPPSGQRVDDTK